MYVEVKKFTADRQYVYLKRSVRVGNKIEHVTMGCLGQVSTLERFDPDIITKLKDLCASGSNEIFSSRLRAIEEMMYAKLQPHLLGQDDAAHYGHKAASAESAAANHDASTSPAAAASAAPRTRQEQATYEVQQFLHYLFTGPQINVSASMLEKLKQVYGWAGPAPEHFKTTHSKENEHALHPAPLGFIDAVVVAAGVGKRMGATVPKQYLQLDGKSVLEHTVLKLLSSPYVARVIVVLSADDPYFKYTCLGDLQRVVTTTGGKERVDSVLAGLHAVQTPWVLVHDAARPLVMLRDIEKLVLSVAVGVSDYNFAGGILGCTVADTLKARVGSAVLAPAAEAAASAASGADAAAASAAAQSAATQAQAIAQQVQAAFALAPEQAAVSGADLHLSVIGGTVDRSSMYAAQTPQLFAVADLIAAIESAQSKGAPLTDESSALEFMGKAVLLVTGSPLNFKLTTPSDLLLMQSLLQAFH